MPLKVVCKRAGHANANVTLAVYAHSFEQDDEAAADTIEDILGGTGTVGRNFGGK